MKNDRFRLAALILFALFGAESLWNDPARAGDQVVAIATDFSTGFLSVMEAEPPWTAQSNVEPTHSDARVRTWGRRVYAVNRFGADNVQWIDPDGGWQTVCQFSVGPGSNPQDLIVVSSEKAYVPRYDSEWLYVVDPTACAVTDSISLAGFADADGLPEMERGIKAAGLVFVNVQRLDRDNFYLPVAPSYLAVIDPETDELLDADPSAQGIQGIELLGLNPFMEIQRSPVDGDLLVGTVGTFGVLDGGIERVDPVTLASGGWMTSESDLGGELLAFTVVGPHEGYAVVSDASFNTCLVLFDPATGDLIDTMDCTSGFNFSQDVVAHDGRLFVGDRTPANPGIRVYELGTQDPVAGPISVGLPPDDMAILPAEPASAGEPGPTASRLSLTRPRPNPAAGFARVTVLLSRESRIRLGLFDSSGRRRAVLHDGVLPAGSHEFTVRPGVGGVDRLPAGSYWIRAVDDRGEAAAAVPLRILR